MKVRVVLGLALACLIAIAGWVAAQETKKDEPSKDPAGRVRGQLPANYRQLGLTDEQKRSIYKIQSDYGAQIDELEAKVKRLRHEERQAMEKILTDVQRQRLAEIVKDKAGVSDTKSGDTKPPEKK